MAILVTGGAGYIGSHVIRDLIKEGNEVIVVDNLSEGHREAVDKKAKFYKVDIGDRESLNKVFRENKIDAVVHFAGFISVGESMENPEKYYENNVRKGKVLLDVALKNNVDKFVFSSSASVYGEPKKMPIKEDFPKNPVSVYAETKWEFEKMLHSYGKKGLRSISLRYFNAAGASFDAKIGEDHNPETHLIPLVLQAALGKRSDVKIFGTDYPTRDGTCIRDYIHVVDLSKAHLLALDFLDKGATTTAYNVGTGIGISVREVIDVCKEVTGKNFKVVEAGRREGDVPELVADCSLIMKELKWKPRFSGVHQIVQDAWKWHRSHPNGFKSS